MSKCNDNHGYDAFRPISVPIWAAGQNIELLATRVFHFLDENQDSKINLLQFLLAVIMLIRADADSRLKFFFAIHLVHVPIQELETPSDDAEEATEAEEFFRASSPDSSMSSAEFLNLESSRTLVPAFLASISSKSTTLEFNVRGLSTPTSPRNSALMYTDANVETSDARKGMPRMYQKHFISMWKTLYDVFSTQANEQLMYHSVATVGTCLLKWGELALEHEKSLQKSPSTPKFEHVDARKCLPSQVCGDASSSSTSESFEEVYKPKDSDMIMPSDDLVWSITFEQFKAALYTESLLVDFFDVKSELEPILEKLKSRRFDRTFSLASKTA